MNRYGSHELDHISPKGWCLVCVAILMTSAIAIVLAGRPIDPRRAVAVFPPWWPQSAVLESASRAGAVMAQGTLSFVVVVQTASPDVVERLREAGALIAFDARLAKLCGAG